MRHTGTITTLAFFKNQNLLSGSEDGTVIIWQNNTWMPLHVMTAKITYPVLNLAIHPTG